MKLKSALPGNDLPAAFRAYDGRHAGEEVGLAFFACTDHNVILLFTYS